MGYDVIVVGGGPAGLSASIYTSRAKLKTLLIERKCCGGQMAITDLIENYPGFSSAISGFDLAIKFNEQSKLFGTEIIYDEVASIEDGSTKKIITMQSSYETKAIIIATGTNIRQMNIPGESNFIGRGVSFCATCDAPFYRDKNVIVIGGGDSAVQEAVYLSKFAKTVTIIHRRNKLRASKILQEKIALHPNISVIYNSILKEIYGKDLVEKVVITDIETNKNKDLKVDGVFVFIGLVPNTLALPNIKLDSIGYIMTDESMNTSVPGIFACGDIRKKQLRQIVTAVADGAQAAISAQHYIESL
ncbi:MAG: thioredoxin-disulfide reductase [Endomicrobium sp.]|jgi:thioredoxin reductase (NADPH)|nr:thioredoxin-disulfide reductase [Endomicrobium sp.]